MMISVRRLFPLLITLLALFAACRSAAPPAPAAPPAEGAAAAPPANAPADDPAMAKSDAAAEGAGSETAASEAKTYKNTIKWATASELDNFGFDVFRSESEDGPFDRINSQVIEGGGTVDEPRRYQFVDDTIDPHKIYYYYVESISMSGMREQFTPIGKVGPKIKPEGETPPDGGGSR